MRSNWTDYFGSEPHDKARLFRKATYVYYQRGVSLIPDAEYGSLGVWLSKNWLSLSSYDCFLLGDDPQRIAYTGRGVKVSSLDAKLADMGIETSGHSASPAPAYPSHSSGGAGQDGWNWSSERYCFYRVCG